MGVGDIIETVAEVADKVQEGVEVGRAAPTRRGLGWCNWLMIVGSVALTCFFIVPPILAEESMRRWLGGKSSYPTYAIWQGWIITGAVTIGVFVAGIVGIVENVRQGEGWPAILGIPLTALSIAIVIAPLILLLVFGIRRGRREMKEALIAGVRSGAVKTTKTSWVAPYSKSPDIGRLEQEGNLPALVKMLDPKEAVWTRSDAAEALGRIGDERAVFPLIGVLESGLASEDWQVAENAAEALGRLGDPRAVRALTTAQTSADPDVATSAREALARLQIENKRVPQTPAVMTSPIMAAASASGIAPKSASSSSTFHTPQRSWWGRRGRGAKTELVLAGLVVVGVLAGTLTPLVLEALRPSDAELVQTLATTTDPDARQAAVADLATRHSAQATEELIAAAGTSSTAEDGLAALRDQYIHLLNAQMDDKTFEKSETALKETTDCLGLIGDSVSIDALGDFACSSQCPLASVRVGAVHTLAGTNAPAAVTHLIRALVLPSQADPGGAIGEAASAALGSMPEAVEELIEARIENEGSTTACPAIEKTLARVGEPAIQPLLAQMADVAWADDVLAAIGELAIPAVCGQLDSQEDIVRYRALGVLLRVHAADPGAVVETLIKPNMVPLLIEARIKAQYGDDRDTHIATVLAQIGEPAAAALVAVLPANAWASTILTDMGATAVPALISGLQNADSNIRFAAADVLVEMQRLNPDSVPTLVSALDEDNLEFIATNYAFYIKLGRSGTEETLARALHAYGGKQMALDYLNCGNAQLDAAAREWAADHGYTVYTEEGTYSGPQWGEG